MKRVVVGLSGGVDSSVAAYLLKEQGYDVIGLFMKNWHDESVILSDECPWIDDANDALLVANKLGIPFQVIDLSKEYKERIVEYMFDEYAAGRTPNPDVLCNREIKFDVFMKRALELGVDYVATGHYCRRQENEDGSVSLLAGLDQNKDQSYFLCQLDQEQLSKALFPVGDLQKSEVRKIAKDQDLITADKKDSQGLCFIGKVSLPDFLQQQLKVKQGNIIEIPEDLDVIQNHHAIPRDFDHIEELVAPIEFKESDGIKVAEHQGAHFYTIGQRKGLHIGGRPNPSFVLQVDTKKNLIFSGQKDSHPGLNKIALKIDNKSFSYTNLKNKFKLGEVLDVKVRIRYRQELQSAKVLKKEDFTYVLFDELQRGITPGQFCAFYNENSELLGSGEISF
ncbi:tRNA 2-thiouridine(34) synthase MnmA [Brumimicrobium aurantiacum]|uniref:tRNA-specific 2-thiouridylase MnmA n=1 Tax=Brumimicrobium aurantiacum TaxID=1737063 RepID=A0A3E1EZV8_9FLAO|nr:tRNA 2-thiouridine(34) synthase MnmA [Brumimicrobium aurantiacum]RFC55109.1 tRNA 2-thiouridine(34) synthase MnmA [Brumimicrobium aurantiacum]